MTVINVFNSEKDSFATMKIVNFFAGLVFIIFSCKHVTFVVTFTVDRHTSSLEHQEEAKISVSRIKRFDSSNQDPYSITITAFDRKYHANVERPRRSIFAPNFKIQTADEDLESQAITINDATLTKDELKEIEDGHYTNSKKQASFSIRSLGGDGGTRKIRGILGDVTVTESISGRDGAISENTFANSTERGRSLPPVRDFLDPGPRPPFVGRALNLKNLKAECEPELFIMYDYALYKKFGKSMKEIIEYTGVLFHAVNNRFATITDVKIKLRITGVRAATSPGAQAFLEEAKIPGGYDIASALQNFSESIYKNIETYPKHDLAIFVSGADLQMKDEKGTYRKTTTGLAWLRGACYLNHHTKAAMGTAVAEDDGVYTGLYTITHELAHNLGADHDGDGASADCPWKDGFIMSYVGYGTKNKFRFSKCSVRSMKKLIMTNDGDCLRTFENNKDVIPISTKNIGSKVTMKQICQSLMKNEGADIDTAKDATTLCQNIHCKLVISTTLPDGRTKTSTTAMQSNVPAGDDTPCGNGGRCWDGVCLQKVARSFDDQ